MELPVGRLDGTICYFHNLWDRVLVIVPSGKRNFIYIRTRLSRREASGIVTTIHILSMCTRVVPCGQTYGRTDMTKLIVAFRNFANEPKKPTRCGELLTSCCKHLTHDDISHKHQFFTRFLTTGAAAFKLGGWGIYCIGRARPVGRQTGKYWPERSKPVY